MQAAEIFSVSSEWLIDNTMSLAVAIIILAVGWLAARFVSRSISGLLPKARGVDPTVAPILSQVARYAILIVSIVLALTQMGVQTASVLAVLGAAGLAIALALQGTLSNIAAGVMLIWLRPLAVGEYIDGKGLAGTVVEIGLFGTRLRTFDGIYLFVPNSQLWDSAIKNYSREPRRRLDLKIGISYGSDILQARKVLMDMVNADQRVLSDPAPIVYVENLGDSAVVMLTRLWVPTPDYWDVLFAFTEQGKLGLDKAGIEIPYNKVDVNILSTPKEETTK